MISIKEGITLILRDLLLAFLCLIIEVTARLIMLAFSYLSKHLWFFMHNEIFKHISLLLGCALWPQLCLSGFSQEVFLVLVNSLDSVNFIYHFHCFFIMWPREAAGDYNRLIKGNQRYFLSIKYKNILCTYRLFFSETTHSLTCSHNSITHMHPTTPSKLHSHRLPH